MPVDGSPVVLQSVRDMYNCLHYFIGHGLVLLERLTNFVSPTGLLISMSAQTKSVLES